jgi:multidrug efflux pump subunit AcrA (membrane-fusion protein)
MAGKAKRALAMPGEQAQAGIVIPETAVFSSDETDKTYVWVIDAQSNQVCKREVRTGDLLDSGITIQDGLKPGEWIATAGVHYLKENQQVHILSESSKEAPK